MQFARTDKDFIILSTNSSALKIIYSVLAAAFLLPVFLLGYGTLKADQIVEAQITIESFSRALEYDPSNARLWWNRGRLLHYSLLNPDIARAVADYRQALALNPYLGQAWVDLSDCYDRMGNYGDAGAALEKAFLVQKYSPLILWQAGNFYLRRSNLPRMYERFRLAGQYDIGKLGIAMEVAWKIDPDHGGILQKLVPDNLPSNLQYLNFLIARDELDLARPVWDRCLKNSIREDFEFKPSVAFGYIDRLLASDRIADALVIWDGALRKAGFGPADTRLKTRAYNLREPDSGNLIWNGSFEQEILRGGFDWRFPDTAEARFQIDAANRMQKLKSLKLVFGDVNLASVLLSQIVPIMEPGSYKLDFYLRTDSLTTDQLPYLTIQGFPDASVVSARTKAFPSTASWSKVTVPFMAGSSCKAIQLSLRRDRSAKFDNQIKGTLWLDGFVLNRQEDDNTDSSASASER